MTTTKKRLVWKKNRIISVKLRNDVYVLGQMLDRKRMIFFNYFSENNSWEDVVLSKENVLFICTPLKTFVKNSIIEVIEHIDPVDDYIEPNIGLFSNDVGFNKKVVTIGDYEKEVFIYGDGSFSVVEFDPINPENNKASCGIYNKVIKNYVDLSDYDEIKNLDFVSKLEGYPNLNERLYLCWLMNRNVNPKLDVYIGLPLNDSYCTYIDILSHDVDISELGY